MPEVSCPLVVTNQTYSCDCKVKTCPQVTFTDLDVYDIRICNSSDCLLVLRTFTPAYNSKHHKLYGLEMFSEIPMFLI